MPIQNRFFYEERGLFIYCSLQTTRKYTKGEFVLEYAGELILNGDANSREKMYAKDEKGCYMYYFNFNQKNYWSVDLLFLLLIVIIESCTLRIGIVVYICSLS